MGQDAGDLVEVGEVVGRPGGEELGNCHDAEGRVEALAVEVGFGQFQVCEVLGAVGGEDFQRVGGFLGAEGFAVDCGEGLGGTVFPDELDAGEPGAGFEISEVGDDFADGPGAGAFVAVEEVCGDRGEVGGEELGEALQEGEEMGRHRGRLTDACIYTQ